MRRATSVFPTPDGPRNRNTPRGRLRSPSPARRPGGPPAPPGKAARARRERRGEERDPALGAGAIQKVDRLVREVVPVVEPEGEVHRGGERLVGDRDARSAEHTAGPQ